MTILSSFLKATNYKNPFLRTLVPAVGAAYALQATVAIPSILAKSEKFYDASGSITYLSVTALSLCLPMLRARISGNFVNEMRPVTLSFSALNWRQVALSMAVTIWATRLGSYLFQRILADGKDSRFDEIKKSPLKFLGAFTAQATWVSICLLPVLALNSIPSKLLSTLPLIKATDVLGLSLFVGGFAFETVADRQKNNWVKAKKRKEHDEKFLTSGLWSKSRHPNYFGEMTLWTGIATTAAGVLAGNLGQVGMGLSNTTYGRLVGVAMCAASPAFTAFLLLKVSGVPLSETKYDKKFGDDKEYIRWKRETPVIVPRLW
ncbi:BgtA-21550 [Blumeria graminis f. sp. tritici]|uniref:BgtA-21550 n=2 Tax=Blumeria graminis f. sp. tritici TaxID=62690 RepID=A0A9X9MJZ2_BLUGR|nr:hypothetical protein BGT96224_A21550 [Blumeria graminis f. sp. tritici 96224]VDB90366.1 BgtA-21550 [Blumeria graminis f. sp. tritici]